MVEIIVREVNLKDKDAFLKAMNASKNLHHPWVKAPLTSQEFDDYFARYQQVNQKSFLVCDTSGHIMGVINMSEIVRGVFQNAYIGFYAVAHYAGKGYMSEGLKLILEKTFKEMDLHRLEANIQPDNHRSIQLVKKKGFRYEGFSPRYLKINGEWRGHEHWAITYEDYMRGDAETLQQDHIDIVSYDINWPDLAKKEINKLQTILPSALIKDIQHVGSTAIPGISAKPIIDIQIAVNSLEAIKPFAISALQKLGYEYWDENPDPTRLFFVKGMPPFGEKRTHHVHIVEHHSEHWRNKLTFRDYMRSHPELIKEYENLKLKLANEYKFDREKYTEAKGEFVKRVLTLVK